MLNLLSHLDPLFVWGNPRAEGCVWLLLAVGLVLWARARPPRVKRLAICAAPVLIAFGASDFVEATTGAWWRPWWLFAWKATCVLALVWLFAGLLRGSARPK